MTQFGADVTEVAPIETAQTVKQGVQGPSVLEGVANVFSSASKILVEDKKEKDAAKKQAILNDFFDKQTAIADSVAQPNGYSSAFGRSLTRKTLMEFRTNYPNLTEDFIDLHKKIVGTAGIGLVIKEGNDQEKLQRDLDSKLVSNGQAPANATREQLDTAADLFRLAEQTKERFEIRERTIKAEMSNINLSKARRNELKEQLAEASFDFLVGVSESGFKSFKTAIDEIVSQKGQGAESDGNLILQIEQEFSKINQEFAEELARVTPSEASALTASFTQEKDLAIQRIKGEISTQAAEAETKRLIALQKAVLTKNPDLVKLVASSELLRDNPTALSILSDKVAAGIFADNDQVSDGTTTVSNPFKSGVDDRDSFTTYLNFVGGIAASGNKDPKVVEKLDTHVNNILEGVSDYEGFLRKNPEGAIALVDWFSTQNFLKLRQSRPEAFLKSTGAQKVLSEHYANEVETLVNREFKRGKVTRKDPSTFGTTLVPNVTGGFSVKTEEQKSVTKKTSEVVNYEVGKNGINFFALDKSNGAAIKEAKRLNDKLKPVIEKTVRGLGHLDGRTDFNTLLEEVLPDIFGGEGQEQIDGSAGNDLTLDDFIKPDMDVARKVFNKASNEKLSGVDDRLVKILAAAKDRVGVNFEISEGLRSTERQRRLVKAGKSQTLNSKHLHGNAVDIHIIKPDGTADWSFDQYQALSGEVKSIAKEMGFDIVWGGDWRTLKDGVHFQIADRKVKESKVKK